MDSDLLSWCLDNVMNRHDYRLSRSLSLFGRRSVVDVTSLLAIADPLFIFHLFCLCLTHLVSISQLLIHYLTLCYPMFVCEWLILCNTVRLCGLSFLYYICLCWVKYVYLLISAVLRLTPLCQLHTDHITESLTQRMESAGADALPVEIE